MIKLGFFFFCYFMKFFTYQNSNHFSIRLYTIKSFNKLKTFQKFIIYIYSYITFFFFHYSIKIVIKTYINSELKCHYYYQQKTFIGKKQYSINPKFTDLIIMSEIRFSSNELLELKLDALKKRMKMRSKKEVIVYLINEKFLKEPEAEKK